MCSDVFSSILKGLILLFGKPLSPRFNLYLLNLGEEKIEWT